MSKKKILAAVIAAVLVLGMAGAVWAATTAGPAAAGRTAAQTKLTEAQRKEMIGLEKQTLEIRKQIIKKQVEFKLLTPAQGKAAEANLDVMAERMDNWDGTWPGPGMGMGFGGGRGRGGFGPGGGPLGGRGGWGGQGKAGTCPYCGATANNQPAQ